MQLMNEVAHLILLLLIEEGDRSGHALQHDHPLRACAQFGGKELGRCQLGWRSMPLQVTRECHQTSSKSKFPATFHEQHCTAEWQGVLSVLTPGTFFNFNLPGRVLLAC